MSRAEFEITAKEQDAPESEIPSTEAELPTEKAVIEAEGSSRRLWPVAIASTLSLLWVCGVGAFLWFLAPELLSLSSPATLFSLLGGTATPIVIFWLVALAFQRTDPTLERRLALSKNLHKAIAPVEVAEVRLGALNLALRKELENIDAVAELAGDRISNLESRFQEQVSGLFSASADAEARVTSISDTLTRERDEISSQLADMETRFAAIEKGMADLQVTLRTTIGETEESSERARSLVDQGCAQLNEAASVLEERLVSSSEAFANEKNSVDSLATDIDLRLQQTADMIHGSLDRLQRDMEGVEGRSHELNEHMQTQGKVLGQLAELAATESTKIRHLLKTHVDDVEQGAEAALQHTRSVSEEIHAKAETMLATLKETLATANAEVNQSSQVLSDMGAETLAMISGVQETAKQASNETLEALEAKTRELEASLRSAQQAVIDELEGTMSQLQSEGKETVTHTRSIAAQILGQVRELRLATEQQLDTLRSASSETATDMESAVEKVTASTAHLVATASEARTSVDEGTERLDEQSRALEETLSVMRRRLGRFEEDLKQQQDLLKGAAQESETVITSASEKIAAQTASIDAQSAISGRALNEVLDTLNKASSDLAGDSANLRAELATARRSLGESAGAFANERMKIRTETDDVVNRLSTAAETMGSEVSRFTESSFNAAERLEEASERLKDRTSNAEQTMRQAAYETQEALSESMDSIAGRAEDRIITLREDLQATLDALLKEYRHTVDQAERESAHLAMRLGREADKIASDAQRFIDKTEEVQRRLSKKSKNDFSKTSALVMESLNSSSIDIYKALTTDVTDDVWDDYLSGDKSIFARRAVKLADRKTRKAIVERFKTDSEFKEATTRFMSDFEGLMERAMTGDRGNALSVTLISSDMGKLYVMLGQSLKKLS